MPLRVSGVRVSGKNIDIGEALRTRIAERLGEALGKYFDGGYSGHVTVERDGYTFRTECVLHLSSGAMLHAEASNADAYASADQAAGRLERRLSRYKSKLKSRVGDRPAERRAARAEEPEPGAAADSEVPSYVLAAPPADAEEIEGFSPAIIAESMTVLKRLSVGEAVIELDNSRASFLLFRHAGSGRLNLVYRRSDGHIGWIDPPERLVPDH